mgnify:CR=1 FL=1
MQDGGCLLRPLGLLQLLQGVLCPLGLLQCLLRVLQQHGLRCWGVGRCTAGGGIGGCLHTCHNSMFTKAVCNLCTAVILVQGNASLTSAA